jgi:hypothetical protein
VTWRSWLVPLLVFTAVSDVSSAEVSHNGRRNGMRGPDYEIGEVTDLHLLGEATAEVVLADGSRWTIATADPHFPGIRSTVELARRLKAPLFVSGDRRTGHLDQVALPELLRPEHVARDAVQGKIQVTFHGPPSAYYLKTDRPWFGKARNLLERTIAKQTPTTFPPELLVTIDVSTMEIMDVRGP